jgi:hypothetical protein
MAKQQNKQADKAKRVDIGFTGGQVLAVRMAEADYKALREALESDRSARWHEAETEDSQVAVDLAQVVYVRLDTEQHRVGF